MNYIVSASLSFRSVENPEFINMIEALQPDVKVPKRKEISAVVATQIENVKTAITEELQKVDYISAAADLWTGGRR
jgi:hypothetical protein